MTVCRVIDGEEVFAVDGKLYNELNQSVEDATFALLFPDLKKYGSSHRFTEIAQLYTLVHDGLILTQHIFKGLNRPLYCDESLDGDQEKLIYTRKPTKDCEWVTGSTSEITDREAPKGHVFVVIISPNNRHKDKYPSVSGWIDSWVWVKEDQNLAGAPINWVDRYSKKLWSGE